MKPDSIQTVRATAPGNIEIVEAPLPEPAMGEALVQPLLVAICGSDLRRIFFLPEKEYPLPLGVSGHEVIARVVRINHENTADFPKYPRGPVREGSLVMALSHREDLMSEYAVTAIGNLLPLPTDRRYDHLVMAQQLGTVIHALKRLPDLHGKTAVVIGQGSAGLFFNVMLKRLGIYKVIAMDLSDARVKMALEFGADSAFNSQSADPVARVEALTGGALADLVVEATGEPDAVNLSSGLLKPYGHLLFFGVPHAPVFPFDFDTLYRKYATTISISGTIHEPGMVSFLQALDLIIAGAVDPGPMLTHVLPFSRAAAAYHLAHTRNDGAGKVLVEMPACREFLDSGYKLKG